MWGFLFVFFFPESSSKPLVCCWELQISAGITIVKNITFNFFSYPWPYFQEASIQVNGVLPFLLNGLMKRGIINK